MGTGNDTNCSRCPAGKHEKLAAADSDPEVRQYYIRLARDWHEITWGFQGRFGST